MTNENEEMISMGSVDSPSGDEVSNGGAIGTSIPLKKGPWTPAEDAILVDYVTKHGEGNWNAVQKHSGLARCGKSCRLRWANHLRPDLKKGAFTPEEERRITELHAKMGNKWARMASELPGRTDNEIKNYWNTRIKRRQRAGLPVYPPDICFQASNDNQHPDDMCSFPSGDIQHHDLIPVNNFEIPAVEFKKLELNASYLDMPAGSFLDIPPSSLLDQRLNYSYNSNSLFSSMHPAKRLRASGVLLPRSGFSLNGAVSVCTQFPGDGSEIGQSFSMPSAYDHNLPPDHIASSQLLPGSHEFINGNFPPSEPTSWAMKLELPSFQNHIGGNWGSPASPLPSLDSVDTLIQSPPTEQPGSAVVSPRNSGLLDAVLYESKAIKNSKNNYSHHTGISVSPGGLMDDTSQDVHATDWESHGDPTSPFGHSAASMFNTYTANSVGSSGCEVRQEALNISTPDILPRSNCYEHQGEKNDEESFNNEIHSWGTW